MIAKDSIDYGILLSTFTHQKCCGLKSVLITISMNKASCIGIDSEQKGCGSFRSDSPVQCASYICQDNRRRSG